MAKFTWDHIHLRTTDPEAMKTVEAVPPAGCDTPATP
jgi:hypothetical protein